MKTCPPFARLLACLITLLLPGVFTVQAQQLNGCWQLQAGTDQPQTTRIIEDDYFMETVYDIAGKKFINTHGGIIKVQNKQVKETIEFNTADKNTVGSAQEYPFVIKKDVLTITRNGKAETWKRLDDGKGALAGNWRITEREQEGKMHPIPESPRKTLKILSGNHFQWAAINTATKEFFGTGGGTYTFENGKYTETIAFFSRDNSRVGVSLSFDGTVNGDRWHHSGLSSKGDKISEIWSRYKR
jgi:hypothetical protein